MSRYTITFEVCCYCGAMYLPPSALNPATVCHCGHKIVSFLEAERIKAEDAARRQSYHVGASVGL